jgi:polyprenyl-phospho-N-acetylgalactosaminyl synthase
MVPSPGALMSVDASSIWIVVPAFNERPAIGDVVRDLRGRYRNIVVVDDGSVDHTAAAAQRGGATVLRHVINRGQGAALATGLRFAVGRSARYVVTFDADGQHRVDDVERLLAPLVEGVADVALGSRFLGSAAIGMPLRRSLLLHAATLFTRATTGLRVTDTHNGLRAFSGAAARSIRLRLDRMTHASEILDEIRRNRLRFVEVPVSIQYSHYSLQKGQSGLGAIRILLDYLVERVTR